MTTQTTLSFKALCPQCGGQLSFASQASIFAVCPYCRSSLSRDAESVKLIGKLGTLLEDYSPIQIGVTGIYHERRFTVIGRTQMRYKYGYWNEWYIVFDDGSDGWLADASGLYSISREISVNNIQRKFLHNSSTQPCSDFSATRIGSMLRVKGNVFTASDKRRCEILNADGELDKTPNIGNAYVIDYRHENSILTLDYTAGSPPTAYLGEFFSLDKLSLSGLRSEQQILDTAGQAKGKIAPVDCPICGASISIVKAISSNTVCSSCHSAIHFEGETAEVIKSNQKFTPYATTLALGEVLTIRNQAYTILGIIVRKAAGYNDRWTEYALFNASEGFIWLIESGGNWSEVQTSSDWPSNQTLSSELVLFQDKTYTRTFSTYQSHIVYVVGAFNWQPNIGDSVFHNDYRVEKYLLSREASIDEITWSYGQELDKQTISNMVGRQLVYSTSFVGTQTSDIYFNQNNNNDFDINDADYTYDDYSDDDYSDDDYHNSSYDYDGDDFYDDMFSLFRSRSLFDLLPGWIQALLIIILLIFLLSVFLSTESGGGYSGSSSSWGGGSSYGGSSWGHK